MRQSLQQGFAVVRIESARLDRLANDLLGQRRHRRSVRKRVAAIQQHVRQHERRRVALLLRGLLLLLFHAVEQRVLKRDPRAHFAFNARRDRRREHVAHTHDHFIIAIRAANDRPLRCVRAARACAPALVCRRVIGIERAARRIRPPHRRLAAARVETPGIVAHAGEPCRQLLEYRQQHGLVALWVEPPAILVEHEIARLAFVVTVAVVIVRIVPVGAGALPARA